MAEESISPLTGVHPHDRPLVKWKVISEKERVEWEGLLTKRGLDIQLGEDYFASLSSWIYHKLRGDQALWRLIRRREIKGWLHYGDAYFVFHKIFLAHLLSGETMPIPAYMQLEEEEYTHLEEEEYKRLKEKEYKRLREEQLKRLIEEQKQLKQLVAEGISKAASQKDLPKWSILKALELSFRRIWYNLELGYIITWSTPPTSASFPIECVFQGAASKKMEILLLTEKTITDTVIKHGVPDLRSGLKADNFMNGHEA